MRCAHHVPYEAVTPPVTYPLPQCSHDATVYVHGYRPAPMPCCDECVARISEGLASVTTTPIT
jgi:hypothetical protein